MLYTRYQLHHSNPIPDNREFYFCSLQEIAQALRYLYSTKRSGLGMLWLKDPIQIMTYSDAILAFQPETRWSWTGYAVFFNKAPIIWRIIKQTCNFPNRGKIYLSIRSSKKHHISKCHNKKHFLLITIRKDSSKANFILWQYSWNPILKIWSRKCS